MIERVVNEIGPRRTPELLLNTGSHRAEGAVDVPGLGEDLEAPSGAQQQSETGSDD